MSEDTHSPQTGGDYYRAVAQRPARELYRQTVARFDAATAGERLAIDLGCGAGIEAADLLRRGWNVLALDKQPEAIEALVARVAPEDRARLTAQVATFEDLELPRADLVWAGLSLPFCPPKSFPALWAKILAALKPGGRFAGDFYGDRCEKEGWAGDAERTYLTREHVTGLFEPLHIEYFIEEEGERLLTLGGVAHMHVFGIVARRLEGG